MFKDVLNTLKDGSCSTNDEEQHHHTTTCLSPSCRGWQATATAHGMKGRTYSRAAKVPVGREVSSRGFKDFTRTSKDATTPYGTALVLLRRRFTRVRGGQGDVEIRCIQKWKQPGWSVDSRV